jgi:recombination protein RecA
VDSVSSLIPSNEAASEIGDDHIALLARLMSKATRRLTPIANRAGCLIIFINQLRMKVGGYGNPETTTGGEALAFYTTGRISVRGPEAKARRIPDPMSGEIIGHTTLFEIVKNKLAPPFKKTEINLIYGKGYDTHWEVLKLGVDLGIIDKKGAWYAYNDANFAQGEPNAAAYLKSDDNMEMHNEIRSKVIDMVGLTEIYEQNS